MRAVKNHFSPPPLSEAIERMGLGCLQSDAVCLILDLGYVNDAEVALAILIRQGIHTVHFLAGGLLDGDPMWNDAGIELIRNAFVDAR